MNTIWRMDFSAKTERNYCNENRVFSCKEVWPSAKAVNQEQLALYYGIGRYVSANTRKNNWGQGAIEAISNQLKQELPGLRGFSATSMRNMRTFYEEWRLLESNSSVATDEFTVINTNSAVATAEFEDDREIRQLQLANLPPSASYSASTPTKSMPDISCRTSSSQWV